MPSIGDVLFVSIFLRLLFLGGTLLNDGDTGWHLAAGEYILRTLSVPHADTYSFTAAGKGWVSHEWFSEVIFALLNRVGGLNGVVVFTAAVIALTFWLMYRLMLKRGAGPLPAAIFTIVAVSASAGSMLARPHILSYPLTLGFFWVLDDYQKSERDRLWLLPLITALWANLHAAFFLGLVFVFLYASGNLVLYSIGGRDGLGHLSKAGRLFLTLAICIVVSLVNPHGTAIFSFLSSLLGRENMVGNILEWASPNFHDARAFELMLLGVLVILAAPGRKPDIFEGGVMLVLAHLALSSVRFIPLFALIAGVVAASRLRVNPKWICSGNPDGMFAKTRTRIERISANMVWMESRLRGHAIAIAAVAAAGLIAINGGKAGGVGLMDYKFSSGEFPVDALEYAARNGINGRIFNEYSWGGYIIYKGGRNYKVFIDGRIEPYGPKMMKEYLTVSKARFGCMDILDKYKVDWVMFGSGSQLCRLLEAKGWKKAYSDSTAEILLRQDKI